MAFDFSKWAESLPDEATKVLVDEGFDHLSALLVCTQTAIEQPSMKKGHQMASWAAICKLQDEHRGGQPTVGSTGSGLLTRTKADFKLDDPQEIRIVLFGKTGNGKSATGNTILGDKGFKEFNGPASETGSCENKAISIDGRIFRIVDTPGVCDTHRDPDEVKCEITKCLLLTSPGPHILLFVMNSQARFTREENDAYMQLRAMFDPSLTRYVCVVFTRCEELRDGKKSLEESFKKSKLLFEKAKAEGRDVPDINTVLEDCNGRYLMFSNKSDDITKDKQVLELVKMIDNIRIENPSPYFQDKKTKEAARQKEARLQQIMVERNTHDKTEAWTILEKEIQNARARYTRGIVFGTAAAIFGAVTVVTSVAATIASGGLAAPLLVLAVCGAAASGTSTGASIANFAQCNIM